VSNPKQSAAGKRKPWHDTPPCPKCPEGGAVVRFYEGGMRPNHLLCAQCGHDYQGTDAEYAQATKADEAYDRAYENGEA